jgi:tetratricopeptide (TPR) repeat protein
MTKTGPGRSGTWLLLIASTAVASPKTAPDKYTQAAHEAFDAARAADVAGKLADALHLYEKANAIAPNAVTVYNIADVQRRMGNLDAALKSYRKYLAMAPDATDRADVDKVIASLEATPGTVRIDAGDDDKPAGTLFIDGQDFGWMPSEQTLPAGEHLVEVVTPISYAQHRCTVNRGTKRDCKIHIKPRADGNVVISYKSRRGWTEDKLHWQTLERITVAPGHYELHKLDKQCSIAFDVPSSGLVYVHVEGCDVSTKVFRE